MKLLVHAILIGSAFLGSDYWVNGGAETRALLRHAEIGSVQAAARLEGYHFVEAVRREVDYREPRLAQLDLRANLD